MEEELLICPICKYPIEEGSLSKHHLKPRSRLPKEHWIRCQIGHTNTVKLHHACHTFLHCMFPESYLYCYLNNMEAIMETTEIKEYLNRLSREEDPYRFVNRVRSLKKALPSKFRRGARWRGKKHLINNISYV